MEKILNISGQNEVEEESYTASVDSQWLDMSWLDRCVFFLSNTLYYFLNPNSGELDCACSLFRKHLSMKKGSEVPEFLQFPSKISAQSFML